MEEVIYLMLHDIIDEIAGDSDDTNETLKDILPEIEPDAPLVSPIRVCEPKRRRLGVNAGAHEQIVHLKNTLHYVSEEKDTWRRKSCALDSRNKVLEARNSQLEATVAHQDQIIRFYRFKHAQTSMKKLAYLMFFYN